MGQVAAALPERPVRAPHDSIEEPPETASPSFEDPSADGTQTLSTALPRRDGFPNPSPPPAYAAAADVDTDLSSAYPKRRGGKAQTGGLGGDHPATGRIESDGSPGSALPTSVETLLSGIAAHNMAQGAGAEEVPFPTEIDLPKARRGAWRPRPSEETDGGSPPLRDLTVRIDSVEIAIPPTGRAPAAEPAARPRTTLRDYLRGRDGGDQ